ncbi:MAG: phosphatidylserine/phosphatidylglycerophosphate/cardiolipin synthase family protein [Acholeplasma sp.]|nr:phosphatidylserine/phosphatidylglycerophosphate/cardiolipin synthase family protein [Acholeplasma sp.]
MELYVTGKQAFIKACSLIDEAKYTIEIQMFIWRDDKIGNVILEHVYQALKRGVKVAIKKDRYGSIFEKAEENKQSLFHKRKDPSLMPLIRGIDFMYADKRKPKGYKQNDNLLLMEVLKHPNLSLTDKILKDHTKYYLVDDQKLLIGGVNIEDKENGKDIQGRKYKDYMVYLNDKDFVKHFKARLNGLTYRGDKTLDILTNASVKEAQEWIPYYLFRAKTEVIMHMAYFGAKKATKAIFKALDNGVKVSIVTSSVSNLQTHYNLKLMKAFYKKGATIYLYEGLVHAKAIQIDDCLIVGSTNLNNSAFYTLGECSLITNNKGLIEAFRLSHERLIKESKIILDSRNIRYNKCLAFLEKLVS